MKKKRYRDKRKCHFKSNLQYDPNETARARHRRRQKTNLSHADLLRQYCDTNGFRLTITNDDMHWQIRRGQLQIDWWPLTAKMVVNQQWDEALHVQDIYQMVSYLDFARLLNPRSDIKPNKQPSSSYDPHDVTFQGTEP